MNLLDSCSTAGLSIPFVARHNANTFDFAHLGAIAGPMIGEELLNRLSIALCTSACVSELCELTAWHIAKVSDLAYRVVLVLTEPSKMESDLTSRRSCIICMAFMAFSQPDSWVKSIDLATSSRGPILKMPVFPYADGHRPAAFTQDSARIAQHILLVLHRCRAKWAGRVVSFTV